MSLRLEAGFEHLREALAEILTREVEFPMGLFVTVLKAKVTANTAHAKITLSVLPVSGQKAVLETLSHYSHEIKTALADRLRLRRIPRLHYVFDETEAEAEKIETLLNTMKKTGEI